MSQFHRNFEFRNPPRDGQRPGYFETPPAVDGSGNPIAPILIGQPIIVDTTQPVDSVYGLQPIKAATGEQAPVKGLCGVAIYEFKNDEAFAGFDTNLTTYSDLAFVPPSVGIQMIGGPYTEILLRNTSALTFLNNRNYAGRIMVAGLGATPTVVVGTLLTPGVGNDTLGYWAPAVTAANAWATVVAVDTVRGEVVARLTV